MKRFFTVGIITGISILLVVCMSWIGFPAWREPSSGGFLTLAAAAVIGVVTLVQNVVSIWKDLKEETKAPVSASIQSISSQQAGNIYNLSGETINFVQQEQQLEKKEKIIDEIAEVPYGEVEQQIDSPSSTNTVVDGLNWEYASSSVIFDGRLADAFPGLRGIEKIQGEEAVGRLMILLRKPLFVELNLLGGGTTHPFWWLRGLSNLFINEFERLGADRVLMDKYDLKVDYIVGVREFSAEERNFVYVRILPDPPTGLYKYRDGWLDNYLQEQLKKGWGYYYNEEFGVWKDRLIRRAEYDDGAAIIDGNPTQTHDAKLRVRYITPYNFVICGQNNVLNNEGNVDRQTTKLLDEMLLGTRTVDDLVEYVAYLEKPRY